MLRLLLIVVMYVSACKSQSSCSEGFKYVENDGETQGLITFENPESYAEIHLKIQLSIAVPLTSKYVGLLSLVKNREDARDDILNNRPLLYRVQFPVQNPVPKVTAIMYNNKLICSGPPDQGSYVTTISLEHTFFTGLQNRPITSNNQPSSFNNQPPARQPQNNYHTQPLPTAAPVRTTVAQTLPPSPTRQPNRNSGRPSTSAPPQSSAEHTSDNPTCGKKETTVLSLIYGGDNIKRGDWPWLVAFYTNIGNSLNFICGGSLISKLHVITAAHCIQDKRSIDKRLPATSLFFFGKHNLDDNYETGYQRTIARKFIVHNDWNINDQAYDADIAIVVLKNQIQFTEYVRPICLWTSSDELNLVVGNVGVVVGWGKNEYNELNTAFPKMIDAQIVSDSSCLRSSAVYREITSDRTFCAGGKKGEGDSGSGLVLFIDNKWFLRGVLSASLTKGNKCDVDSYAVYTDVAKYGSWINYHTTENLLENVSDIDD
ncbi:unnamed protein product [Diamesa serratosioi]